MLTVSFGCNITHYTALYYNTGSCLLLIALYFPQCTSGGTGTPPPGTPPPQTETLDEEPSPPASAPAQKSTPQAQKSKPVAKSSSQTQKSTPPNRKATQKPNETAKKPTPSAAQKPATQPTRQTGSPAPRPGSRGEVAPQGSATSLVDDTLGNIVASQAQDNDYSNEPALSRGTN